ncbi:MAG: VWA domain-containing protein, partial [Planctomycetes bacterium]|nr:VWA domain-containing protein [Planctomycetota bacterium]
EGTTVTLTARPEVNWRFRHWNHNESSANPITVVLEEGNNSFGAYFEQLYTLSLASDPPAGGTILVDPPSGPYANDETVTLTAQPAAGFRFARWTGDAGGSTNPRTLSFSRANRSVTAVFEIPPPSVKSLGYETRPPFVVRFHMRLHDGDGHAISEGVTREMFSISENSQMLDYRETNQFVRPGPDLPLKVVLVLDYTASMKDAGAIDDMVVVAKSLIRAGDIDTGQPYFTATHHIGIVEFHDRPDDGFGEAMPLTRADEQGKNDLVAGVPAEDSVEHGLTRVWDAVDLAINMLRDTNRESGEVWAIVFLTDGYDTTSSTSANSIRSRAQSYDITLYPIGFGDVKPEHREAMQSMATNTGGLYSEASDAQALYEAFAQVVEELRGQWNLTYITQRNSGTVNATVTFAWQSGTTSFSKSFSASSLEGDIHQGEIDVIDRSYDEQANQTTFYLKATYVPRNISRFRFPLGQDGAAFTTQGHGGLLQGWTLNTPQSGVVELYAPGWPDDPIPLEYGSFGNIGWVTVPGDVAMLKLDYDQTVYDDLPHEKTMKLGGEYLAP